MTALLAVEKLCVFYDAFQAVHDVDLTSPRANRLDHRRNGAGKSSFLKALVRQAGRVTGSARFAGEDLSRLLPATSSRKAWRWCRRGESSFRP